MEQIFGLQALRSCAMTLLLSAAAVSVATACKAQAIDCWLLEGQALDRAHQRGLCKDAFARNSVGGAPAAGEPIVVPKQTDDSPRGKEVAAVPSPRPAAPPAKPKRDTTSQAQPRPVRGPAPAQSQPAAPSWNTAREAPSWNAPRPPERVVRSEEIAPEETAEIPVEPWPAQRQPPPKTDPVDIFMDNLQRDFQSLVGKLISGR